MKTKSLALLAGVALAVAVVGCYSKVSGGHRFGSPFVKDQVAGVYERSMDEVYNAAKAVVGQPSNGLIVSEGIDHSQTNLVKTIEARVNQRRVYVQVEQLDPKQTQVKVQARTSGGGSDLTLAHELEKEIALKLVR